MVFIDQAAARRGGGGEERDNDNGAGGGLRKAEEELAEAKALMQVGRHIRRCIVPTSWSFV